jgi:hypothetical protein
VAGTNVRPDLPAELDPYLTTTVQGQWVLWAQKLARPAGDLFVPMTGGAGYPADATASCRHGRRHDAPNPRCTCGFHALSGGGVRHLMMPYMQAWRLGDGAVALSVALSGRVLAFEWAGGGVLWRAARQTVIRVERPDRLDPWHELSEMSRFGAPALRLRRQPGDPDGRLAVVAPVAPRDSGPVRLELPDSAPVLPVCHDDAGWCAVPSTPQYLPRSLAMV